MNESFDFKVMDDSASGSDLLKDGTHHSRLLAGFISLLFILVPLDVEFSFFN